MSANESRATSILRKYQSEILNEWITAQLAELRPGLIEERELRSQCREFLELFLDASTLDTPINLRSRELEPIKAFLAGLSRSREQQGFSPTQTALFIFSLKRPWFIRMRSELANDALALFSDVSTATELLDTLGLYTTEVFQKGREEVINQQTAEMLELSTPVVELWDGVVALPLIGTLDSNRTQVVMETLLNRIVENPRSTPWWPST
jgi:rsbT co-antagonist protein RsbR